MRISIRGSVLVCVLAVTIGLFLCFVPARAATLTVTTTTDRNNGSYTPGNASLREAVRYAASGDTVQFAVNGTFILTLDEIEINKNLTIDGNNLAVTDSNTVVSGDDALRVFNVTSGTVTIKNLAVVHGYTTLTPGGGGIANDGVLTLDNVRIADCTGHYQSGGGVYSHGDITINNCRFSGNQTHGTYPGGGLTVNKDGTTPTANITDTYFGGNVSQGGGGGLYSYNSVVNLSNCTFELNQSTSGGNGGGALAQFGSTVTVTDSTFDSNTSTIDGGAVYSTAAPVLTITGCTFSANSTDGQGGALRFLGGTLDIINSTFSGNQADESGGAMWLSPNATYPAEVSFSTINGNTCDADCGSGGTCGNGDGGGIYLDDNTVFLKGVILAGNYDSSSGTPEVSDCEGSSGGFSSQGYNLIGCNSGCSSAFPYGTPSGNQDYVGTSVTPLPCALGTLADNGGPTRTCALVSGNLAINHGPPDCNDASGNPVTTDQRGLGRNRGGQPDIGAYEVPAGSGAPLAMLLELIRDE